MTSNRKTIAAEIRAEGVALHAGGTVHMTLAPAPADSGVVFRRSDQGNREIRATYDAVTETRLGTVIAGNGISIGVIEHLMAAVAGAEIDDLLVELDGPEPPILDGDALSYLKLIQQAGIREQAAPRRVLKVLKPITVESGNARASLSPSDHFEFDFEITFESAAIGHQHFNWRFSPASFATEIAPARTFGFLQELDLLLKAGLGRGASLANTLAIDGGKVVNADLMRFPDEFVRHKILDALGDLALAGGPILARFEGVRSGHALNNALLRALFADPANFAWGSAG
jgi:UDP-3-O-[3-hydroxymyristoyl] N-acetylglucosamine deacetylase